MNSVSVSARRPVRSTSVINRIARRKRALAVLFSASAMVAYLPDLQANSYTWDPGNTPTTPSGGAGTWSLSATNTNWSNGATDVAWTDNTGANDTAYFAGTAGTVTLVPTNLGAVGLIFQTAGYDLAGNGIVKLGTTTVNATGIDTSAIGTGSETLGNVDVGSNQSWNLASANVMFNGAVRDNGISHLTLTVNGTGTTQFSGGLTLSQSNSARTVVLAGSENIDIGGLITDGGTNVTNGLDYQGTATLTLGNTGNTFQISSTQAVGVFSGTIAIAGAGALGPSTNPIQIGNTNFTGTSTFEGMGATPISLSNPVTLDGGVSNPGGIGGSTSLILSGVLSNASSVDPINVTNTGGTTLSGTLYLSNNTTSNRTLDLGGSAPILITATVADGNGSTGANPCSLEYSGTSTLTYSSAGPNTYTGNTIVAGGTVLLTNAAALGSSTLQIANNSAAATFEGSGASMTIPNNVLLDGGSTGSGNIGGSTSLTFSGVVSNEAGFDDFNITNTGGTTFSSNVYLSNNTTSNRTLDIGGTAPLLISGVIGDANGSTGANPCNLQYSGTSTLTLTNANTYTGNTTIAGGTVVVANSSGSATGTGNVALNGGVLASGATGSISGNVVGSGSNPHTIAPGGIGSVGVLTVGGLTTTSDTTLSFQLGTGGGEVTNGSELILGTGTVSIASGTNLAFTGTPAAGNDYRLIGDTSSGSVVNAITLSNFTLPSAPGGLSYALNNTVDADYIDLVVTSAGPVSLTWNNTGGTGDGATWNTAQQNWNNGSGPANYSDGSGVIFNDNNNSHYSVTLSTTVSPASVQVTNNLGNYTISGIGSIAGSGSLTKAGTGSLTLGTSNSYSGGTNVNGGKLIVAVNSALPKNQALSIGASGAVQLTTGTGGETLSSLAITTGGTLDVGNNHVIINYSAASPKATILNYLATGAAGGAWNGTGIISSTAASLVAQNYGVSFSDGADNINPALTSGQIQVAYSQYGDITQQGLVNAADFHILASNFGQVTTNGWEAGDFLYQGVVNANDFHLLAENFGQTASGESVSMPASDWAAIDAFESANSLSVTSVPEPASFGLLMIATAGVMRRRRKSDRR